MADTPATPEIGPGGGPVSTANPYGIQDAFWGTRFYNAENPSNPIDSVTRLPIGTLGRFSMMERPPAWQGQYQPSPALAAQMAELKTNPTSGYSPNADYGAQLSRWQFSNSAPIPRTAPVGWGRYPGTGGAPPQASWVTNPYTPGSGGGGGSNYGGGGGGSGTTPPQTVTPPQQYVPPGWTTGTYNGITGALPTPSTNNTQLVDNAGNRAGPPPQTTTPGDALSFLKQFQFQNAAPGSDAAKFNAVMQKYGPNDAMNLLLNGGLWNTLGSQFQGATQQAGLSRDDYSRLVNEFGAGGGDYFGKDYGFNAGKYTWGLGGKKIPGLIY